MPRKQKQNPNQKWNPAIPLIFINYLCKFYENGHVPWKIERRIEEQYGPSSQIHSTIHYRNLKR